MRARHAPHLAIVLVLALVLSASLSSSGRKGGSPAQQKGGLTIQNTGSDTMAELAQQWAEEYSHVDGTVSVEVSGGGSGVGITNLISGLVDIANCSRAMSEGEKQKAKTNTDKDPIEWIVGYDGLAVYVHKDNPVDTLSLDELADIYGEKGETTTWSQLGVDHKKGCPSDEIVRVSRQSSSGTYVYFREVVLHKGDYKLGSRDLSGSKDVVDLVGHTPCAIGYSGMGFKNDHVKFVKISLAKGAEGSTPSVDAVKNGDYPLARPLRMYTLGQPTGHVKKYLDWILSPEGQAIVQKKGVHTYRQRKGVSVRQGAPGTGAR